MQIKPGQPVECTVENMGNLINEIITLKQDKAELIQALEYAVKTMRECVYIGISLKENSIGIAIDSAEQLLSKHSLK